VATDERIWLKEKIFEISKEIKELQRVIVKIAEKNFGVIIPGYTHLRQAQPVLFSHYIMSLFWKMQRGEERLLEALKRVDELPLGCGAFAGSSIPIDRNLLKKELRFSKISENSIDSVSDRNFILEVLFALSLILLDLSRYAEDFIIFSSEEFPFT
jgi:argininosuccinate lyase